MKYMMKYENEMGYIYRKGGWSLNLLVTVYGLAFKRLRVDQGVLNQSCRQKKEKN